MDAHQKSPLPGSEGYWDQQVDIPLCSIQVATEVYEVSGNGQLQQY